MILFFVQLHSKLYFAYDYRHTVTLTEIYKMPLKNFQQKVRCQASKPTKYYKKII